MQIESTSNKFSISNATPFPDEKSLHFYRKRAEADEESWLHPQAALSRNHSCFFEKEIDHRLPYKRDVDRIIHSKAYARYADKTQVVYLVENDHVTHRGLHVQLVSNFARSIAEVLHLNQDLVEAIALGHDVGHPPFGHEGEEYLSSLSQEFGNGAFAHPLQSCRLFSEIESLNLGLAVYDGFLCHDGGMCGNRMIPAFGKTWEDHHADRLHKLQYPNENIWPGTLEGCLVKICDTISYLAKDIEDAINLGILKREEIPLTILGNINRDILKTLAEDLIKNSYGKNYIEISQESYDALHLLRKFNFEHIYTHPKLKVESEKVRKSYRMLFELLLDELEEKKEKSYVWRHFLLNKSERYLSTTSSVQKIIDYISGMTDTYFVRTLHGIIIPSPINLAS